MQQVLAEIERSQRWLAKATGLNHVTVCRLLAGKQKPEYDSVCKIVFALPLDQEARFKLFALAGYVPPELTKIFCANPVSAGRVLLDLEQSFRRRSK